MTAAIPASVLALVVASYWVGRRYGTRIGIASALLVAFCPLVVLSVAEGSSDLVVAALWTVSVAAATATGRRHALMAGCAAVVPIVLRVTSAPLAIVIGCFLLFRPERNWPQRTRAALQFGAPCVVGALGALVLHPGVITMAAIGAVSLSFSSFYLLPVFFALLAPLLLPGALSLTLLAGAVVNVALFTWRPGESSGVALLLPAAALTTVLAIASFDAAWRRSRLPRPAIAVAVASVALVVLEYTA